MTRIVGMNMGDATEDIISVGGGDKSIIQWNIKSSEQELTEDYGEVSEKEVRRGKDKFVK